MKYIKLLHGTPKAWDEQRKPHKGGDQTSTTVQSIPAELKPLATEYTNTAIDLNNTPYQPYTGTRYEPMNSYQTSGLTMAADRALNGSPIMDTANQTLMNTLQGGQTNPYLDSMVDRAQQSVAKNFNMTTKPQTEAAMVGAGAFGNSGLDQYLQNQREGTMEQMGNIATSMYGGAYDQDRARQMQALGMSQSFANAPYQDASQLLNAGQYQQDQAQQNKDFSYQQFQEAQNDPYKKLAAMSGVFGTNLGGTSTTTGSGGGK